MYKDIENSRVVFEGNGTNIPGKFPLGVRIFVTTTIGGKPLTDTGTVFLKNSSTTGKRYYQGDGLWAGAPYDSYLRLVPNTNIIAQPVHQCTIAEKGCALTCMAMLLKAYGNDETPFSLNTYMKNNAKFTYDIKDKVWTGGVYWTAIQKDPNFSAPINLNPDSNQTQIDLTKIDENLNDNSFVIARVNGGAHWILVTGKHNGVYSVIDPAGNGKDNCKKVTLDSYVNKDGKIEVRNAMVIKRK